jgi:NAD(P)-dependent dehydrogenase (short-subunit alcohol dehydrogenase family)
MSESFAGKTVIITGASSGIGAAIALEFAKCKTNLVLNGRKLEKLQETKTLCSKNGCNSEQVVLVDGDITEENVRQAVVKAALDNFGQIDILINNAGTTETINVMKLTMKDFDEVLAVNLRGPVGLSLLALPHLVKSKGNIVNVGSVASIRPITSRISYGTSKAGLDMFTKTLAFNIARHGVRVNSVNPGVIPTNFGKDANQSSDVKAKLKLGIQAFHPIGRVGTLEEVTNAVLFLASDKASFTTGQIFWVDGGAALGGASANTPPSSNPAKDGVKAVVVTNSKL